MSDSQKHILYLAFGERYINQAILSIISLINVYDRKLDSFKIKILTDKPDGFLWLSQKFPVEAIYTPQSQLDEWSGSNKQVLRTKIKAIQGLLDSIEGNLLYVDTDTLFLGKVETLFARISSGISVMHAREWRFTHGRKLHPELCPNDLEIDLDSGLKININDDTFMWNSGVVGISSAQKRKLIDVLELNDKFYGINPSWHVEQLSLGIVLSKTGTLIASRTTIFHYWPNKEVADPFIQGLQSVKPEEMNVVLKNGARNKWNIIFNVLRKSRLLKLKESFRDLPGVYRLYLLIKPIVKLSSK